MHPVGEGVAAVVGVATAVAVAAAVVHPMAIPDDNGSSLQLHRPNAMGLKPKQHSTAGQLPSGFQWMQWTSYSTAFMQILCAHRLSLRTAYTQLVAIVVQSQKQHFTSCVGQKCVRLTAVPAWSGPKHAGQSSERTVVRQSNCSIKQSRTASSELILDPVSASTL